VVVGLEWQFEAGNALSRSSCRCSSLASDVHIRLVEEDQDHDSAGLWKHQNIFQT